MPLEKRRSPVDEWQDEAELEEEDNIWPLSAHGPGLRNDQLSVDESDSEEEEEDATGFHLGRVNETEGNIVGLFDLQHVGDSVSDEDEDGESDDEGSEEVLDSENTLAAIAPGPFLSPESIINSLWKHRRTPRLPQTPSPSKLAGQSLRTPLASLSTPGKEWKSPKPLLSSPLAKLLAEVNENLSDDPKKFLEQGMSHLNKDNLRTAAAFFSKCIAVDPQNVEALRGRSCVYMLRKLFGPAKMDLDTALKISKHDSSLFYDRSVLHRHLGDTSEALVDLNHCVDMSPSAKALTTRGYVHILAGDFGKAIEDCTQALALNPTSTLALYNRSLAFGKANRHESAMADMKSFADMKQAPAPPELQPSGGALAAIKPRASATGMERVVNTISGAARSLQHAMPYATPARISRDAESPVSIERVVASIQRRKEADASAVKRPASTSLDGHVKYKETSCKSSTDKSKKTQQLRKKNSSGANVKTLPSDFDLTTFLQSPKMIARNEQKLRNLTDVAESWERMSVEISSASKPRKHPLSSRNSHMSADPSPSKPKKANKSPRKKVRTLAKAPFESPCKVDKSPRKTPKRRHNDENEPTSTSTHSYEINTNYFHDTSNTTSIAGMAYMSTGEKIQAARASPAKSPLKQRSALGAPRGGASMAIRRRGR